MNSDELNCATTTIETKVAKVGRWGLNQKWKTIGTAMSRSAKRIRSAMLPCQCCLSEKLSVLFELHHAKCICSHYLLSKCHINFWYAVGIIRKIWCWYCIFSLEILFETLNQIGGSMVHWIIENDQKENKKKVVSILAATARLELSCHQSKIRSCGMTQFDKMSVSLSCKWHVADSVAVMLHVWYPVAFRFDSHLGDFPFVCFTFFKNFQSVRLGVRFKARLALGLS